MKTVTAVILGLSIIVSAALMSHSWKQSHHTGDTINVKGSAKKDFVSDLIVWRGSYNRKEKTMQAAYGAIKADADAIKKYLVGKGVAENTITFTAIDIRKRYTETRDNQGNSKEEFSGYELSQDVQVESGEVEKVGNISREITELINQGIEINSREPRYYYTKLAELKVAMLAEATRDARARAEKISENAGNKIGKLRKADMGVFQITARYSSENFEGGGAFNTSSKEKTASITMHLEYGIE